MARFKRTFAVISSALTLSMPVFADEIWSTTAGEVVYEADLPNGMAVFDLNGVNKMFLPGLAGQHTGRGSYNGVWIITGSDAANCDIAILNPQTGEFTQNWGRVRLSFLDPDYPGRWVATGGDCMETPDQQPIFAEPVLPEN